MLYQNVRFKLIMAVARRWLCHVFRNTYWKLILQIPHDGYGLLPLLQRLSTSTAEARQALYKLSWVLDTYSRLRSAASFVAERLGRAFSTAPNNSSKRCRSAPWNTESIPDQICSVLVLNRSATKLVCFRRWLSGKIYCTPESQERRSNGAIRQWKVKLEQNK